MSKGREENARIHLVCPQVPLEPPEYSQAPSAPPADDGFQPGPPKYPGESFSQKAPLNPSGEVGNPPPEPPPAFYNPPPYSPPSGGAFGQPPANPAPPYSQPYPAATPAPAYSQFPPPQQVATYGQQQHPVAPPTFAPPAAPVQVVVAQTLPPGICTVCRVRPRPCKPLSAC